MVYEVGALANVNGEDDKKFTYNMYRTESVDPTKDFDFGPFSLSDYYGSAIMPSLNWVTKVKTGEVVYDPADCLLYTSPSPRDVEESRMPSSA